MYSVDAPGQGGERLKQKEKKKKKKKKYKEKEGKFIRWRTYQK